MHVPPLFWPLSWLIVYFAPTHRPLLLVCLCLYEARRAEQPIGSGRIDEAGRRLYLPSGADSEGWNVLSPNSLPLSAVMWTAAPTLGSLRRAVMWASGVQLVLLATPCFWKAATHSHTNTYTPALCTYCKHASHERKPGWVSALCAVRCD